MGMFSCNILRFGSSEIAGNAFISIYYYKNLLNFALQDKSLFFISYVISVSMLGLLFQLTLLTFASLPARINRGVNHSEKLYENLIFADIYFKDLKGLSQRFSGFLRSFHSFEYFMELHWASKIVFSCKCLGSCLNEDS